MDEKQLYKIHADFCKFMGNPKRIEILFLLGEAELCVDDIAKKMGIRVPNVSQLLSLMREKGVVEIRREGTRIFYRLSNPKVLQACQIMKDVMFEQMEKKMQVIKSANQ
ncbi:MAG: transcriptional regulator [Candidatus Margulisiibacteriota bacterium]|nr:MAG: transcriptional regulator [Candidatus Margulisiibacteriota bacterium]HAR62585.1 transcriptional regulator [Candidatus Margulisiibacteriota bacterium]HCT84732.1 transcriptional regulator [Candidatus Margulisiibacteriota bacterium]HCY35973.1 transcriptional regulator [Candidatus Margulisiibacteriota bacterium]